MNNSLVAREWGRGGNWGFIDKTGKMVINVEEETDFITEFHNGWARVETIFYCYYIDKNGRKVWQGESFIQDVLDALKQLP